MYFFCCVLIVLLVLVTVLFIHVCGLRCFYIKSYFAAMQDTNINNNDVSVFTGAQLFVSTLCV
jgi:hypothetical protein